MKIKVITKAVSILLLGCVMAGCNHFDDPDSYDHNIAITDIYVELTSLTLVAGGTQTITFWPLPANADPMKLDWTSSNPDVATIDRWGRLATYSAGTATLTVSSGNISKQVVVTVTLNRSIVAGAYTGSAQITGFINTTVSANVQIDSGDDEGKVMLTLDANVPGIGMLTIAGDQNLEETSPGIFTLSGNATLLGMGIDLTVEGTYVQESNTLTLELVSPGFVSINVTAAK